MSESEQYQQRIEELSKQIHYLQAELHDVCALKQELEIENSMLSKHLEETSKKLENERKEFQSQLLKNNEALNCYKSDTIKLKEVLSCLERELMVMKSKNSGYEKTISNLNKEIEKFCPKETSFVEKNPDNQNKTDLIVLNRKVDDLKALVKNYQEENENLRKRCDILQNALNNN